MGGKRRHHVFLTVSDPILFILAGNDYIHLRACISSKFDRIRTRATELATL